MQFVTLVGPVKWGLFLFSLSLGSVACTSDDKGVGATDSAAPSGQAESGGTGGSRGTGGRIAKPDGNGEPQPTAHDASSQQDTASGTAFDLGRDKAPSADTTAPDASPDAGNTVVPRSSVGIACKDAKLCDDFETYAAGTAPAGWSVSVAKGATLTVSATKAFSGTKAILITTPGDIASAWMRKNKSVFPLAGNVMHGRFMTFLTASPAGPVHWNSIQAGGARPDKSLGLYQWGGMVQRVMANYWSPDCSKSSKTQWPTGRWACLQWQFDGSPAPTGNGRRNEMRFWIDGTLLNDVTIERYGSRCVNTPPEAHEWVAPLFDNLQIGWESYQTSKTPVQMWIDDIAVDSRAVSCPPIPQ